MWRFRIPTGHKVGMMHRLPTVFKLLEHTAAALRKPSVDQFTAAHKHHPCGRLHSAAHRRISLPTNTLIALAMVVGTYIKMFMIRMIVPPYERVFSP